jgi:uncharacterized protein (TIGR02246 family)
MLNRTVVVAFILTLLLMVGCSSNSTPPAPADTRVADAQAVKEVEAAWIKGMANKDLDQWASYLADDAVGLYPGSGILNGRAAMKTGFSPVFADPNFALTFQQLKQVPSKGGDMVYCMGTFSWTFTDPKTKKPHTDKGKYLTIYMKQGDGNWKAVADTYNSDTRM